MGRSMITKSGNDRIYTPLELARAIVERYKPNGRILEPCSGNGSFLEAMPAALSCEIDLGTDFMDWNEKVDWIVTNPPYSRYLEFLRHSFELANNVVFLQFVNAFFMRKRVSTMVEAGFEIRDIWYIPTPPKPWPQTGFQVGTIYWARKNS